MFSKFALLGNILLASVVLAAPSSHLAARLARRRDNRQSQPIKRVASPAGGISNQEYSDNWAGAVIVESQATFNCVYGTFIVPTNSSGGDGSGVAIWVGIDGDTCQSAILQAGIDLTIDDGEATYDGWYEWYPDSSYDFPDITIDAGDIITISVCAPTPTSGIASLENQNTSRTVTAILNSSYALCEENAEWIVEDFEEDGGLVPLADFGTVTFTDAYATDSSDNVYTPGADGTIIDIEQNGEVLTSVSTNGETVTVQYV